MIATLCLTHACNLRCDYCYAGRKFRMSMNRDTAQRAIEFGLEQSETVSTGRFGLRVFGGEPLMEWDLLTWSTDYAIDRCSELGIDLALTLTTNGTLLTADRLDWIRERHIHLGLSMDGTAGMHDVLRRFRNGHSSHARTAEAMRRVVATDYGAFEVIVVPDPRNVRYLAESVGWLAGEGVRSITVNPNFYTDWSEAALAEWNRQYRRIGDFYLREYRHGRALRVNVIDGKIKTGVLGGYRQCDTCSFGEAEIAVAPSGNMYPCERLVSDDQDQAMCIGTVFDGFDEAKRQVVLSHRNPANTECVDCAYRPRCMNWCCCINYATTGRTDTVHAVVCFHEQLAIAVADDVAGQLFAEANPAFLEKFYSDAFAENGIADDAP